MGKLAARYGGARAGVASEAASQIVPCVHPIGVAMVDTEVGVVAVVVRFLTGGGRRALRAGRE